MLRAFVKFQFGYVVPLLLNGPLLFMALKIFQGNAAVAQAVVICVLAVVSFSVNRYLVFAKNRL